MNLCTVILHAKIVCGWEKKERFCSYKNSWCILHSVYTCSASMAMHHVIRFMFTCHFVQQCYFYRSSRYIQLIPLALGVFVYIYWLWHDNE